MTPSRAPHVQGRGKPVYPADASLARSGPRRVSIRLDFAKFSSEAVLRISGSGNQRVDLLRNHSICDEVLEQRLK